MSSEGDRSRDPEELEPEMEATVTLLHAVETPDFYDTYAIVQVLADNHNLTRMVVEGIEDGEKYYVLRYRLVSGDKAEKIKNYYATFEQFSKGIFAPSDLLRLWKTSTHQLKPESGESSDNRSQEHAAEEFVAFFEWGEPDYIDLPRLTNMQAIKFLRSLVEILEMTADMTRLTHGDICLENIILVGAQLKLSGWKPFFFTAAEDENDWWKDHVVRMYGRKRLDLLLVGLLWMQLYMVNMRDVFAKQKMSFLEFETFVMDAARADPRFGPDHLLVTKILNLDLEDFSYSDLKIELDCLLVEEERIIEVQRMSEAQEQLEQSKEEQRRNEEAADEAETMNGEIFRTERKYESQADESRCETHNFGDLHEASANANVLDVEEDELAEMSFAEQYANRVSSRKKESPNDIGQNGHGSRHVGSPGSPLQKDATSKKKGGILSLAQSLRISDSVDYSIRSMEIHQNGNPDSMHLDGLKFGSSGEGILAASLREEQQRLKETIEKEKQLSEGLKLLHLKHYDQALGCLEPLQEYYKTDARKMSALLSYLAECHLYQDIHNVDNFNTFKAKHSSERQALMSSISDLIQEGLKQYESAIRDGYAEDYAWEVKAWTLYGTALFHQGDPHEALQALTSALESEKKLVVQLTDYERAYLLSKMADAEFLVHHKEDSLESCKLAAEIFGEGRLFHPPSEEDAELFESWSLKHYQEAMDLCLKLAERFKDLKAYEEELEVLKDGISMTVDFQDIQGLLRLQLAKAYQLISAGYLHIGKLSNAEEAGHQAVKLYQEETSHLLHIEISRCLFNVGVAKLRSQDYEGALTIMEKSLQQRFLGTPTKSRELGTIYVQKGLVLQFMSRFQEAIGCYELAIECYSDSQQRFSKDLSECYANIGHSFMKLDDMAKAKQNFELGLSVSRDGDEKTLLTRGRCYNNLAAICFEERDYTKAKPYLEKAIEYQSKYNQPPVSEIFDCCNKLAFTELFMDPAKIGELKTAIEGFEASERLLTVEELQRVSAERQFFHQFHLGCFKALESSRHYILSKVATDRVLRAIGFPDVDPKFMNGCNEAVVHFRNALNKLRDIEQACSREGETKTNYQQLKSAIKLLLACSVGWGSGDSDFFKIVREVSDEIVTIPKTDTLDASASSRNGLLPDSPFIVPLYSDLTGLYLELQYLGLKEECNKNSSTALDAIGVLRRLANHTKPSADPKDTPSWDSIMVEMARMFEEVLKRKEEALKVYIEIMEKSQIQELRTLAGDRVNDLMGKKDSKSANQTHKPGQKRESSDLNEEKQTPKSTTHSTKTYSKSPNKNTLIFTPNSRRTIPNPSPASQTPSLVDESSKDGSQKNWATPTHTKLVFKSNTPQTEAIKSDQDQLGIPILVPLSHRPQNSIKSEYNTNSSSASSKHIKNSTKIAPSSPNGSNKAVKDNKLHEPGRFSKQRPAQLVAVIPNAYESVKSVTSSPKVLKSPHRSTPEKANSSRTVGANHSGSRFAEGTQSSRSKKRDSPLSKKDDPISLSKPEVRKPTFIEAEPPKHHKSGPNSINIPHNVAVELTKDGRNGQLKAPSSSQTSSASVSSPAPNPHPQPAHPIHLYKDPVMPIANNSLLDPVPSTTRPSPVPRPLPTIQTGSASKADSVERTPQSSEQLAQQGKGAPAPAKSSNYNSGPNQFKEAELKDKGHKKENRGAVVAKISVTRYNDGKALPQHSPPTAHPAEYTSAPKVLSTRQNLDPHNSKAITQAKTPPGKPAVAQMPISTRSSVTSISNSITSHSTTGGFAGLGRRKTPEGSSHDNIGTQPKTRFIQDAAEQIRIKDSAVKPEHLTPVIQRLCESLQASAQEDSLELYSLKFFRDFHFSLDHKKNCDFHKMLRNYEALMPRGDESEWFAGLEPYLLYIQARLDDASQNQPAAIAKLESAIRLNERLDLSQIRLETHILVLMLAECYLKSKEIVKALELLTQHMHRSGSKHPKGSEAVLKLYLKLIESLSISSKSKPGSVPKHTQVELQSSILQSLEQLSKSGLDTVLSYPPNFFKDKILEARVLLALSLLQVSKEEEAQTQLDLVLQSLTYIGGQKLIIARELLESLIYWNRPKLVVIYLERIDRIQEEWDSLSKNFYFACVMLKLGHMARKDSRFTEGMSLYEQGLQYMKRLKEQGVFSTVDEPSTRRLVFELLFHIATCFQEMSDLEKSEDMLHQAEEFCFEKNTEAMGECHLLRAKLNFARHNILGCLEYLAKSYECGDRYKESQRRRCEIFFYRCLCLIQQGNKKEAYDAWKTSHKCLDHIKDVKEMQNLKDKLNIAMMRCYD